MRPLRALTTALCLLPGALLLQGCLLLSSELQKEGEECDDDSWCKDGLFCADDDICMPEGSCSRDTDCGTVGARCEGYHDEYDSEGYTPGSCTEPGCSYDHDCPNNLACSSFECETSCTSEADCQVGFVCNDNGECEAPGVNPSSGACQFSSGCPGAARCIESQCVRVCAAHDECPELFSCDFDTGSCFESGRSNDAPDGACISSSECGFFEQCLNGECVEDCYRDDDCPSGMECNILSGDCQ